MERQATIAHLRRNPQIPVLIIGAGINGSGLFRELCLQGVDALLIDRRDFMAGASAAPSRMIHGGLRYLENREVRLVRESLAERNRLLQNAPHYVKPLPTVIPIYHWTSGIVNGVRKFLGRKASNAPRGAFIVKLGLLMYDIYTRNQRIMPPHAFSSRTKALQERPLLDPRIIGTALFYDAWISFPERLGIELIQDGQALNPNGSALNYVSATESRNGEVWLRDEQTGEPFSVRPQVVVNATGAWIDLTNQALGQKTRFIGGTKGSHLMVDNPVLMAATKGQMVYYETDEGRICILFPLHGKVMIGSTDINITNPDEAVCTDEEADYMLACVRQVFPTLELDPSQIVFRYSGVRPLPSAQGSVQNAQISRDHNLQIVEPNAFQPFPILNLVGGKWTTFRAFSEQTADQILQRLGRLRQASSTDLSIGGGINFPKTDLDRQRWTERVSNQSGLTISRIDTLLFRYGTVAETVAAYLQEAPDALLKHHTGYSRREIDYLIRWEFVQHLDDLVLRRTVMALAGELTRPLLHELAGILADCLTLSSADRQAEIDRTLAILARNHQLYLS
ncbi:glycerol-3-phosphate dehydrogenase/oxidase [Spirosoma aureum]|uniref:Glycerol-3-phosphate dehydrogenase/oxidase n=1 Tax=Spirosoma aureum TaxID=2692134 RepID=A0A6G9AN21_9BACT|nr:glycerol-3-phosphate dehydrogenase/oxidase [Spirosoma aureum]QIP13871.1 glycerol-3-phosphate dehydrogenase/oxidase [Spirosoma aureum]